MRTGSSRSAVLPIAPSTYYEHLAKRADPARLSDRARDEALRPRDPARVSTRTGRSTACGRSGGSLPGGLRRCPLHGGRLMKAMGIQGIIRGKPHKTTIPDKKAPCPLDKVNRQFRVPAPNMLWVSDFTYVATWKGFVYVAFVIDAYARRIVGWRVSTSAHAGFVLDALEQAVHERRPVKGMGLVHHSATADPNTCPSNTPNAWRKQASNPRLAASVTATTTRWPRRSTACSRPRSSTVAAHGAASRPSNTPPWNGSTGSTTAACSSQSGTSRPQKPRPTSTPLWKLTPWPRN
jgi:putative transposase